MGYFLPSMMTLPSLQLPMTGKSTGVWSAQMAGSPCQMTSRPSGAVREMICAPSGRMDAVKMPLLMRMSSLMAMTS